jgi:hypothetical protein
MDMVPQVRRRYSTCFKKTANQYYPNTEVGKPGSPGLLSEKGYWDPKNPANTTDVGKPPGMPIGKEAPWYSGDWFNVAGSRWLDAVWVDSAGNATDMWDIKFGDDRFNDPTKNRAYEAIANKHGAYYNGEFLVPSQCNDCADEEEAWRAEKLKQLNALGKGLSNAAKRLPLPLPGGGRLPVPVR